MLISLKYNQHKIASAILCFFVGSWLLLLCQACLAVSSDIEDNNEMPTELSSSCHSPDLEQAIDENNDHCLGVCDCDTSLVTMNSDKGADLSQKLKSPPDLYVYTKNQIQLFVFPPTPYRLLKIPESAIRLPFQTYNILLI